MTASPWDDDGTGEWLTVEDCARRMRVSQDQVLDMVRRRVLRTRHQWGVTLVQPAIVSGAVE
ncbi:hypothetical protein [Mycolicibacterium gadium]|uniref:hypothetical protein n=1 Tax=Mycolicibacterium gadium TaxID=1794 RepID=UPI0013D2D275|nr:hypothetical protein [Mycolicibacterium gadium]